MGKRKEPIVCYKVLERENGSLLSPLYDDQQGGSLWAVGEINKTGCEDPVAYDDTTWFYKMTSTLHGGGFHTCKTLEGAELFLKYFVNRDKKTLVIAECEITLDAKFVYEGLAVWDSFDPGIPGYVSESLKIVKIIE